LFAKVPVAAVTCVAVAVAGRQARVQLPQSAAPAPASAAVLAPSRPPTCSRTWALRAASMGAFLGKGKAAPARDVSAQDRAVLSLKTQRDKLKQYQVKVRS